MTGRSFFLDMPFPLLLGEFRFFSCDAALLSDTWALPSPVPPAQPYVDTWSCATPTGVSARQIEPGAPFAGSAVRSARASLQRGEVEDLDATPRHLDDAGFLAR